MLAASGVISKITIFLAGVQRFLTVECRVLLEKQPDFHIIGESEEASAAGNLVEFLKPDVLIIDRKITGQNPSGVINQTREKSSKTKIMVFSESYDEKDILVNLQSGAEGFISNESLSHELVRAIREVNTGRRYMSSSVLDRVIINYVEKSSTGINDSYDSLTNREREILHLIACGYSTMSIAGKLHISRNTVESHRTRILRKMSSRS
jgi:two-component system, NarL family, response regulator NreC